MGAGVVATWIDSRHCCFSALPAIGPLLPSHRFGYGYRSGCTLVYGVGHEFDVLVAKSMSPSSAAVIMCVPTARAVVV